MKKTKKVKKVFGYHMILDLYGCNHKACGSLEICYNFLDKITDIMKTHKQAPPYIIFTDGKKYPDKAGLSGWVPIVESGVSIHTLTVTNFITIDVYSCKKFDQKKIKNFIFRIFKPKKYDTKYFPRAVDYIHPAK
ncbi:MAG: S-adenosylmethionine decarboxylase [Candidatus Kerfeldbacteria bacterium]|nr:S-adenosylmethionine decarboxylase [Candidatus Kerfeldbacteria bacterium]